MPTEIYSCQDGQALKEGRLELSHEVTTKDEAEADARYRCKMDPTVKKMAYYKPGADGDMRLFYSYTNPYCKPAPKKAAPPPPASAASVRRPKKAPKKAAPKPGLISRVMKSLGL